MWRLNSIETTQIWQNQEWNNFPWLTHGFTTINSGNLAHYLNDDPSMVRSRREKLASLINFPINTWVMGEQVHKSQIKQVDIQEQGSIIPATDGLLTSSAGTLLVSFYADCVPVLFLVPSLKVVGITHAGWRGTVSGIAGKMVDRLRKLYQVDSSEILVGIAPSIGSCCYRVGEKVANQFPPETLVERSDGIYLDLKLANQMQLEAMGLNSNQINSAEVCTCCNNKHFSYRRQGEAAGRMVAFIGINLIKS